MERAEEMEPVATTGALLAGFWGPRERTKATRDSGPCEKGGLFGGGRPGSCAKEDKGVERRRAGGPTRAGQICPPFPDLLCQPLSWVGTCWHSCRGVLV